MLQQATIDLSLFLRGGSGCPTLAGSGRLPAFPEVRPVEPKGFDTALQTASDVRPEPRRLRLRLQRDRAAVDLRFVTNQTLPSMNVVVAAAQDVGYCKSTLSGPNGLDRTTLSAGVAFALPVQQREARGRVVQAQLAQLEEQLRQAEDVVRAEFDAEVVEVGAQQDYFRASADFRAALVVTGK